MRRLALLLALIVLSTACGEERDAVRMGERDSQPAAERFARSAGTIATVEIPPSQRTGTRPPTSASNANGSRVWKGFEAESGHEGVLVARAKGETAVFDEPGAAEPTRFLSGATILGSVTVLTVVGEPTDGWAEVMLPIRPNGSTGWIRVDEVDLYLVEGKILVDLSERRLTYVVNGEERLDSTVAIGQSSFPTPTGRFFVTDSVTITTPGGPWGPHALGLSARSDTITEFNGGDGIIGIHGTNNPGSIGTADSLGCVRLPNDLITALHEMVPLGTPVEIRS